MLRIVIHVLVFMGFLVLAVHFWIGVEAGEGASMLWLSGITAAFLAFLAMAWRTRLWLRSILFLAALSILALLVDQLAYFAWHSRFESFVTGLRRDIEQVTPEIGEEMNIRPTYLRIEPDQALLFTFEPPALAWTYHLESASPWGRELAEGGRRLLARLSAGVPVDEVARTIIEPHQAYQVTVASGEAVLACRDGRDLDWMLSVEAEPGGRPL